MMRAIFYLCAVILLAGCAVYVPGPHPLLVVPDGFRGEIFLFGDKERGVTWKNQPLVVPKSGLLRVANLEALAAISPDAYDARYASGGSIGNRNRGGDWNTDGLWPVEVVGGDHETLLVYLVVGTFHEKTLRENDRMEHGWKSLLEDLREGKSPNQALLPTPMAVMPAASAPVTPATAAADL
jgi:hypothetical protein